MKGKENLRRKALESLLLCGCSKGKARKESPLLPLTSHATCKYQKYPHFQICAIVWELLVEFIINIILLKRASIERSGWTALNELFLSEYAMDTAGTRYEYSMNKIRCPF